MNLDDVERFRELDPSAMLNKIDTLPDQLEAAWKMGHELPLVPVVRLRHIVIAGMGGSAIGGDLLTAYSSRHARAPIVVWRDYDLPAFAAGPETLLIASSHSGDTEEVLSSFEKGISQGVTIMAVTTGGELGRRARRSGVALWRFDHPGPPRTAVAYSFGLLLAAVHRLGVIADPSEELADAVSAMRRQQAHLRAEVRAVQNPAKRVAGQLMERWPVILGAGVLAPVARRWRTQINEVAKAVAQSEELPEADHNLVAGLSQPEPLLARIVTVFLRGSLDDQRHRARIEATRQLLMVEGINTDFIDAAGETRMAQLWTCLHFGDYVAYYLAMAYGLDPTPIAAIEALKERLRSGA
ncbi:MAG TPA: bifunctional phosphoglucose/phosphomannose isomerase [Anaerolineales bacterium]|nr:bifunctional phosphoglucose/phosphomannose isomerase [Anaerolineales bacterium]